MTRYAEPLRCPDCRSALSSGAARCDSCGLSLRGPLAAELYSTLVQADLLLTRLRAQTEAQDAAASGGPAAAAAPPQPLPPSHLPRPFDEGTPPTKRTVSAATVPRILLTLGAICLLAAALVFLAVNWSRLGVDGRTAALIVFTLITGTTAAWAGRRHLRAGLESLGLVTYGLIGFDLVGAQVAGWFGDIDGPETLLVLGVILLAAGLGGAHAATRIEGMRFIAGQTVAALAGATVLLGLVTVDWWEVEHGLAVALLVLLPTVQTARALRLRPATVMLGLVSLIAWAGLATRGLDLASDHPSWRELAVESRGWPLLLAAAVPWFAQAGPHIAPLLRRALVGLGGAAFVALLVTPSTDEPPETWLLTLLALTAASALVTRGLPDPVGPGWGIPTVLLIFASGGVLLLHVALGLSHLGQAASESWRGTFGGHTDPLVISADMPSPIFAGLVAWTVLVGAQAMIDRFDLWSGEALQSRFGLATLALTSWLGVATLDIPVWIWVASGLALVAAALTDWFLTRSLTPLAWAMVALTPTLIASFFAGSLTLLTLSAVVLAAAWIGYRESDTIVAGVSAAAAVGATGAWIWDLGYLNDDPTRWTALVAMTAVALLALLHALFAQRGVVRVPTFEGVEVGAFLTAGIFIPAGLSGTESSSALIWLAAYLTVLGAGICAVGLAYPRQRLLLWPGAIALAAASWVRLGDLGVETPEAYTLPWATLLALVGGFHVVRRGAASLRVLGPGLGLGLTPSLLWALEDPLTLRSALLGGGCLLLVLLGAAVRWAGPLVYGAAAGAVLVVRLASPFIADAVPRWVIIGVAGTVLVVVGLTWERRLAEAKHAWRYMTGLR